MPFRSKAQRRWMYAAEARGELPKGTAKRWEKHTKNKSKLPERVSRKKKAAADIAIYSTDCFLKTIFDNALSDNSLSKNATRSASPVPGPDPGRGNILVKWPLVMNPNGKFGGKYILPAGYFGPNLLAKRLGKGPGSTQINNTGEAPKQVHPMKMASYGNSVNYFLKFAIEANAGTDAENQRISEAIDAAEKAIFAPREEPPKRDPAANEMTLSNIGKNIQENLKLLVKNIHSDVNDISMPLPELNAPLSGGADQKPPAAPNIPAVEPAKELPGQAEQAEDESIDLGNIARFLRDIGRPVEEAAKGVANTVADKAKNLKAPAQPAAVAPKAPPVQPAAEAPKAQENEDVVKDLYPFGAHAGEFDIDWFRKTFGPHYGRLEIILGKVLTDPRYAALRDGSGISDRIFALRLAQARFVNAARLAQNYGITPYEFEQARKRYEGEKRRFMTYAALMERDFFGMREMGVEPTFKGYIEYIVRDEYNKWKEHNDAVAAGLRRSLGKLGEDVLKRRIADRIESVLRKSRSVFVTNPKKLKEYAWQLAQYVIAEAGQRQGKEAPAKPVFPNDIVENPYPNIPNVELPQKAK